MSNEKSEFEFTSKAGVFSFIFTNNEKYAKFYRICLKETTVSTFDSIGTTFASVYPSRSYTFQINQLEPGQKYYIFLDQYGSDIRFSNASTIEELQLSKEIQPTSKNSFHYVQPFVPDSKTWFVSLRRICLLYTSDAADDLLCVDLGGRRII
eukprot:TRINITY_DN20261_c0_g1_i2.p1 TRINITY_DN20261_c0_g1~~TRINITY_DN20261_c0_g1_i2.p1  ORF type:complete len:152 (+),score=3.38 TRINITY_DN20261_c0_g1_i2:145-600(+)